MATFYSVQKTKWDQDEPNKAIKPIEMAGVVRTAYALYESSAEAAASVIEMFNLPNGARILRGEVKWDALGTSTTISVGHAAYNQADGTVVALDVDEYLAATASTSLAITACAVTTALGRDSVVDADGTGIPITIVTGGAAVSGTIELRMEWVLD